MKLCFFTVNQEGNITYPIDGLKNSIEKYYPNVPFLVFGEKHIISSGDPLFLQRATASLSLFLKKDYEIVVKIKHNFELLKNIDDIIEGDYSAVVVKNLYDKPKLIWNVNPVAYIISDFIVLKSEYFIKNWLAMCHQKNFLKYPNHEEDKLNILVYYGDEIVRILDKKDLEGKIKL